MFFKSKLLIILPLLLLPSLIAFCAEIRLNSIPVPAPSAKLRVFLLPVSNPPPVRPWPTPDEEWARLQITFVGKFLEGTGIYELVSQEDFDRVRGKKIFSSWEWSRSNWSLLRQVGQALHADYAMIIERTIIGFPPSKDIETVLINVETGNRFKVVSRLRIDSSSQEDLRQMQTVAYRDIFRQARSDLLSTAMRRGRLAAPKFFAGQPSVTQKGPGRVPPETSKPAVASVPGEIAKEVDYERGLSLEKKTNGKVTVAVYDFDTIEPYRVISLILAETLRQELFRLGVFDLVNRENIVRILNEMALQQMGLVDEKEAVKVGKGLAARQIVIGQYGSLNKTSVLQAKRVDVETQRSLGFGVLKCNIGQEEELLQRMPELAKEIAEGN